VSPTAIRAQIAANAAEITRLMRRIDASVLLRDKSPADRAAWEADCAELHRRYNSLAFPGGYGEALEKFHVGDPSVIEPTLCFLEQRPYFFRSGYMFTTLMRRVKRADLTKGQRQRLEAVLARQAAWKARKQRQDQE
jgi:hypothetical protein